MDTVRTVSRDATRVGRFERSDERMGWIMKARADRFIRYRDCRTSEGHGMQAEQQGPERRKIVEPSRFAVRGWQVCLARRGRDLGIVRPASADPFVILAFREHPPGSLGDGRGDGEGGRRRNG